jgi:hypothetical protein
MVINPGIFEYDDAGDAGGTDGEHSDPECTQAAILAL